MTTADLIHRFLDSPARNQWLENEELSVYIRKSRHRMPAPDTGSVVADYRLRTGHAIDIASVEVREPFRRQGVFSRLLATIEEQIHDREFEMLYVENTINPHLRDALIRRGWLADPFVDYAWCFYKWVKP